MLAVVADDAVGKLLLSVCPVTIMLDEYHRAAAYVCCSIMLPRSNVVEVRELITSVLTLQVSKFF